SKKNAVVMVNQAIKMEEIKKKQEQQAAIALEEIKKILQLDSIPSIIEGFDVSNIEGKDATGSMVCFIEGKPSKENYRYFKIRSKSTPDDVSMMKEIIKRRYTRLLKESGTLPDLILVDGGKGQLNAGLSILKELQLDNIPIIGLAKKFEEIYVPGKSRPIILPDNSPLLRLFEQVRDEAHRFALKLHKKQREKKYKMSILDQIPGIGPKTRNKLLLHFGSIQNIKKSSLEELKNVIGEKLAKIIKNNLSEEE
ncbi:MAG: helix-hairpin-helix domain-containing protein, partial [Promethearchaeota archaeon]